MTQKYYVFYSKRIQSELDSWDSLVSMRSDETWNGGFEESPTTAELLARDEWLLVQLDNSGAPTINAIVSLDFSF